jgi:hypothetical protein
MHAGLDPECGGKVAKIMDCTYVFIYSTTTLSLSLNDLMVSFWKFSIDSREFSRPWSTKCFCTKWFGSVTIALSLGKAMND